MNRLRHRGGMISVGTAVVLLALAAGGAAAQDLPPAVTPDLLGTTPTLIVDSEPPGAVVTLRGAYEWTGLTPWRLYREVSGLYRVEVRLPGYEAWTGEVMLGPGGVGSLQVKLGRKTAAKTFVRSAVLPGWGQIYRGQKWKGSMFVVGTVVGVGAVIWTNEIYRDEVDNFEAAERTYEQSTHLEEWPARYEAVRHASSEAEDAYDHRSIALACLGGFYALNLLDCLLFTPTEDVSSSPATGRADTPDGDEHGGIGWLADVSPAGDVRAALRLRWN